VLARRYRSHERQPACTGAWMHAVMWVMAWGQGRAQSACGAGDHAISLTFMTCSTKCLIWELSSQHALSLLDAHMD
jgi:hypothetical protein